MPRSERAIRRIHEIEAKEAFYALLDENNVVIRTYTVLIQDMLDTDGNESDFLGKMYWKENYNQPNAKIIRCLYGVNWNARKPVPGYTYDEDNDVFVNGENPHPGVWIFDMERMKWAPPIKKPKDGKSYEWNSELYNWVEIT